MSAGTRPGPTDRTPVVLGWGHTTRDHKKKKTHSYTRAHTHTSVLPHSHLHAPALVLICWVEAQLVLVQAGELRLNR